MRFPDLALARRIEFHEVWSSIEHARTQAQLYPETEATFLPIAGGCAVFCGRKAPLSKAYGIGLSGRTQSTDLDKIEAFFVERNLPSRINLCPLADTTLFERLRARAYGIQDFMNAYYKSLEPSQIAPTTTPPNLKIRVANEAETRQWFEQLGAQGNWAEPDGITFMTIRCTLKANTQLFLAWRDSQIVGGGALEIHDDVGALMAAATLPQFRNQGVQTALLKARLTAATRAGCDLAIVHTEPGMPSQRNILRAGFQLAYTLTRLVRRG